MTARYVATDYLYATARIRSLESGLVGRERLYSLLEMKTADEVLTAMSTWGIERITDGEGRADAEAMLINALRRGIDTVRESVPAPLFAAWVQYPYDCHNIKSYLKCIKRGTDPAAMMVDAGTVSVTALLEAMQKEKYDTLPAHMGASVPQALMHYAGTADPREIDFCLDRACFADLAESIKGFAFGEKLLAMRVDLINIKICRRLLCTKNRATAPALFEKAAIAGGTLQKEAFAKAFEQSEAYLTDMLKHTPYEGLLTGEPSAADLEKRADDCMMRAVREVKYVTFGPEVPFAYLYGLETAVKNLRIVLAGKRAGLTAAALRERVRESYV